MFNTDFIIAVLVGSVAGSGTIVCLINIPLSMYNTKQICAGHVDIWEECIVFYRKLWMCAFVPTLCSWLYILSCYGSEVNHA